MVSKAPVYSKEVAEEKLKEIFKGIEKLQVKWENEQEKYL